MSSRAPAGERDERESAVEIAMVPKRGNIEHENIGTREEKTFGGAHQDDEDQNPGMESIAQNRQDAEEIEGITSESLRCGERESVISGAAKPLATERTPR